MRTCLVAVVDDCFAEQLAGWKYRPKQDHNTFYAIRDVRRPDGRRTTRHHHHDVLELAGIEIPAGYMVDHRDGDGLNNQLANLRVCTPAENRRNSRSQRGSSSQFLGVYWDNRDQKWQAGVQIDGRQQHLGYFDTEYDAALAYDLAAMSDPFARLNILAA